MAWLDKLESDVKSTIGNRPVIVQQQQPISPTWLFGLALLLVIGVYTAWQFKNQNVSQPWAQQPSQQNQSNQQWYPQQQYQPTTEQKVDALKIQYDKLDAAAHKIWDRTKWNTDRLTLLATVNNHNMVVIQHGYPRSELILLNPDWTINKMPDRIQLDPADKEFLKQFVVK